MSLKKSFSAGRFICRAYYVDNKFRIAAIDPNSDDHFVFYTKKLPDTVEEKELENLVLSYLEKHKICVSHFI